MDFMSIEIQGIIAGMTDLGCRLVKVIGNKIYFEIPKSYTQDMIDKSTEVINHYGYRLFIKRI